MNSIDLLKMKNNVQCVSLDETITSIILGIFNQSNIKVFKNSKKQTNILKNTKIQTKKDMNENKLIMIMNKLSHNNMNELINEYLTNVLIKDEEEYNIIQYEIFLKMVKDITFINNYIPFIIKIFSIEKYKLSYYPTIFINTIYSIINYHYKNITDSTQIIAPRDDETHRISCVQIIKKLISFNFFSHDLYHYVSKILLTQIYYKIDIFYWFNDMTELSNIYKNDIIDNIQYCIQNNMHREQLMIESLFQDKVDSKMDTIVDTNKVNNTVDNNTILNISIKNILDEYVYLEIIEEVVNFVNTECTDHNQKNVFSRELLTYYFSNNEKKKNLLSIFESLIKKKVISKSNITGGLLLYLDNNTVTKNDSMEYLLKFLRNNNITKNIEFVFKKYKIKI